MLPTIRKQNLNWLPSVFSDFFNDDWFPMRTTPPAVPAINVKENDKAFELEMAVPGMSKEDFHVHVNDKDQLVVSVEKKDEKKEDKSVADNNEKTAQKFLPIIARDRDLTSVVVLYFVVLSLCSINLTYDIPVVISIKDNVYA